MPPRPLLRLPSLLFLPPFLLLAGSLTPAPSAAQGGEGARTARPARITEEIRTLATYPFSEPNPVPILTRDRRLYPYHAFEGYSASPEPREWKVVKLENDLVEVFVLPEVGGKVWGAVVKATGHEFIYRNEVMKFRNIALRGPWTSGGIEMNFGVIGHTPATATPVDHLLRENPDGSVSCWVGSTDLPSRTVWRVEIRLPADEAVFETNVFWYNPTPLEQPYYNWMTAAAFARPDLEMSMPGNAYLQHSGEAEAWPVDEEGRYLPLYGNNTFESHKSYHVVGELRDFFGGYYHDEEWGFGHWARHEEMPGQKLWLWALSREGGVWEDLLTDTDGQYVEFQAGRLFVQYSPGSDVNPITQAGFEPHSSSRWTERWFPVEGIGGLTEASEHGALFAAVEGGRLAIGVNAFRDVEDTLKVWAGDGPSAEPVAALPLALTALEPFRTEVEIPASAQYRIRLPALGLDHASDPSGRRLSRPFATPAEAWASVPEVDRQVFQARELMKGRYYPEARALFEAALEREPWNREALLAMAELEYRRGAHEAGLARVDRALRLDAYDPRANFIAGILHRALGRGADARDAFGWAARSTAYRAAAYVQMAELEILAGSHGEAARYARLALDHDRTSVGAWQALAVLGRRTQDPVLAREARRELLALDPLNHFAAAEAYLAAFDPSSARAFQETLGGEFPDQTLLELAVGYARLGLEGDALTLLGLGGAGGMNGNLVHRAWMAWLGDDPSRLAGAGDPAFVFPYRPETLPVLEWAAANDGSWVWRYLLALNLWALDRDQEAAEILAALGAAPDFAPFYGARAHLLSAERGGDPQADLRRAVALEPADRTLRVLLVRHLQEAGRWGEALTAVEEARGRFPRDFNLQLLQAKALIHSGRPGEAADILAATQVLPSEGARESHTLWEQAHTLAALDAVDAGAWGNAREHLTAAMEWPEHLGQGRSYEPEERLARFILGRVEEELGNQETAREAFRAVVASTPGLEGVPGGGMPGRPLSRLDLLALPALERLGRPAEAGRVRQAWGDEGERLRRTLDQDLDGRMILRALSMREGRE